MKVKISDLLGSENTLVTLSKARLPVQTSYALAKNIRKISPEIEQFNEMHKALVIELGEEKEGGGWNVKPENMDSFREQYAKLLDIEVDVEIWQLPLDDSVWGNLEMTPEEANRVWFIFKMPE